MKVPVSAFLLAVNLSCFAQQNSGAAFPGSAMSPSAPSCDCTSYPFKPNPPCFGSCVGKLSSTPNPDLTGVKGLDPGVAVNIRVLAANPKRQTVDFSNITGKPELEIATDKSLRGTDLRLQAVPIRQMQRER